MNIPSDEDETAAVRRALMRVKPDYFSWLQEDQEKYRATMPEEDDFRIRQTVLNEAKSMHTFRQTAESGDPKAIAQDPN